jgi:diguanylate cyclase (GGDEF)-like protein/PAS domain S-box-containing protein
LSSSASTGADVQAAPATPGSVGSFSRFLFLPVLSCSAAAVLMLAAWQRSVLIPEAATETMMFAAWLTAVIVVGLSAGFGRAWYRRLAEVSAAADRDRAALRRLEDYRRVFRHFADASLVLDPDTLEIVEANWRAGEVFDVARDALTGRTFASLSNGTDELRSRMEKLRATDRQQEFELVHRRADGTPVHLHICLSALEFRGRGAVLALLRDISARRGLEQQLRHQVFHDRLTGLPNRALFLERVEHAFTRASRGGRPIVVMFLDLDDFKAVNDSLGHAAGDELLVAAARRLGAPLRMIDTVARLGGDEFAILLEDAEYGDRCLSVAERILFELDRPFEVDGREVFAGTSIGIASSEDADSAEDLIRHADMAMYAAKERGKCCVAVFEPRMLDRHAERMDLESALRQAVEEEQFELHYQPIVSLDDGRIAGFEALLRWNHARRGVLEPSVFIPLAEQTGLILPLGAWALERACLQLAAWRVDYPHLRDLTITVNLAPRQLGDPALPGAVRAALDASGLPARALVLEATEDAVMQDLDAMYQAVHVLDEIGVQLTIDNFGTGFSSLSHLARLPLDVLKIDRTFVAGVARSTADSRLARTIVAVAETLGVQTVAEGVRTREQVALLRSLGCRHGQGFLFSPPVPAHAAEEMLARGAPLLTHDARAPSPEYVASAC